MNHILDERGAAGSFLKVLFGYNGNPSLLEVIAYSTYFIAIGAAGLWQGRTDIQVAEMRA